MQKELTIGNKNIQVEETLLLQADLSFYPENPRIYSVLNVSAGIPEQNEIEEQLKKMEHVKQLRVAIDSNGGLIDPLIVREGDYVVLEGNSRLAAYRILAEKDPIKWAKVKCTVLPSDISESDIFALLGQYHIIGKKDWSPYEQAGYLYRRVFVSNILIDNMADELGIARSKAKRYVQIYSFMKEKEDLSSDHWSYYEEYFKSPELNKFRKSFPEMDDTIVQQVKNRDISQAIDIRTNLVAIAKVKDIKAKKILQSIAKGEISIYNGFERIEDTGKTDGAFQTLNKFRLHVSEKSFEDSLLMCEKNAIEFELKKIKKAIEKFMGVLDVD